MKKLEKNKEILREQEELLILCNGAKVLHDGGVLNGVLSSSLCSLSIGGSVVRLARWYYTRPE